MNESPALRQRTLELPVRRWMDSPWRALLLFAVLGWLWFVLCRQLSYEWSANEQYSYGWFVPFFALFLFGLRWEELPKTESGQLKPEIGSPSQAKRPPYNSVLCLLASVLLLAALLPIRLFEIANPDWRPLSWGHALVIVGYSLVVIGYWGGKKAVWHFAFPVCFILVAVPWLTPIEAPLVQGLMRLVALVATETLTLFGIPAQLEGSLIRVGSGVVGVSEACSGVRSLQTSLMIGLLFGELKSLTIARRCALVGAALAIALFANFARAFFLVWVAATENLAAVERWHDLAGYAIVGLVFVGTVAIASALSRTPGSARASRALAGAPPDSGEREVKSKKEELRSSAEVTSDLRPLPSGSPLPPPPFRFPHYSSSTFYFLLSTFTWLLLIEASVSGWYRWHERGLVASAGWTVRWPKTRAGYHEIKIDDQVRSTLRFDAGQEAAWRSPLNAVSGAPSTSTYLFFFRWNPGGGTVLRARAHRPDICLPSAGWKQISDHGVESVAVRDGVRLPVRRVTFLHNRGNAVAHTFFVLQEDRLNPREPRPDLNLPNGEQLDWSFSGRWSVVRNGVRNLGQQTLELIIVTSPEVSDAMAEQQFTALLREIVAPAPANQRS